MKRKSLVAAIAASSLMISPALAQSDTETSSGPGWATYLLMAGIAAGWILMIVDDDNNGNDNPASP